MLDFGFYNMDCMEGMKQFPDNYFDLAIVDPPYGDGGAHGSDKTRAGSEERSTVIDHLHSSQRKREREKVARTGGTWASKFGKKIISWDVAPKQEYFDELFRISRNQIIWGGQLFLLTADKMLSRVEKAHSRKLLDGNV
jgi:site-specific DNA-methyltransferase (adenine-specific)